MFIVFLKITKKVSGDCILGSLWLFLHFRFVFEILTKKTYHIYCKASYDKI